MEKGLKKLLAEHKALTCSFLQASVQSSQDLPKGPRGQTLRGSDPRQDFLPATPCPRDSQEVIMSFLQQQLPVFFDEFA